MEEKRIKKPFYKKWWVYVLVFGVLAVIMDPSSGDGNANKTTTTQKKEKKSNSEADKIKKRITKVVGKENVVEINYVPDNNFLLIRFKGSSGWSNKSTVKSMYLDITNLLKELKNLDNTDIDFNVVYPLTDAKGNETETIVIKASFKNENIKSINFDSFLFENIPKVADEFWEHDALK